MTHKKTFSETGMQRLEEGGNFSDISNTATCYARNRDRNYIK